MKYTLVTDDDSKRVIHNYHVYAQSQYEKAAEIDRSDLYKTRFMCNLGLMLNYLLLLMFILGNLPKWLSNTLAVTVNVTPLLIGIIFFSSARPFKKQLEQIERSVSCQTANWNLFATAKALCTMADAVFITGENCVFLACKGNDRKVPLFIELCNIEINRFDDTGNNKILMEFTDTGARLTIPQSISNETITEYLSRYSINEKLAYRLAKHERNRITKSLGCGLLMKALE